MPVGQALILTGEMPHMQAGRGGLTAREKSRRLRRRSVEGPGIGQKNTRDPPEPRASSIVRSRCCPGRSAAQVVPSGPGVRDCPISRVQRGASDNREADPASFVRSAEPGAAIRTKDFRQTGPARVRVRNRGRAMVRRRQKSVHGALAGADSS
jgi:hypothetical protein